MSDFESKVDQLGELLRRHGLTSIRVRDGDVVIEVRRDVAASQVLTGVSGSVSASAGPEAGGRAEPIPSPMVGTFYRRPVPTDPPFVEEGERIAPGQVIGVIEAMKVFNEVESPIGGVLTKFLVSDGQLVQEGDALALVEP